MTLVDRDSPPPIGQHRRGVPQGRHLHALPPSGAAVLEELFPGLLAELAHGGAPVVDDFSQMRVSFGGHPLCNQAMPVPGTLLQSSRPYLEGHVRARVRALPNIGVIDDCEAVDLATAAARDQVTAARVLRGGDGVARTLDADLVVDATGRGGRTTAWLLANGYDPPAEEQVQVHIKYASRALRLRPGALSGSRQVIVGAQPGRPRGMGLFAVEHDRWLFTVFGYAGPIRRASWPSPRP